eukprot:scaffold201756_cov31-Tisochrysis_lutea.AAC.3
MVAGGPPSTPPRSRSSALHLPRAINRGLSELSKDSPHHSARVVHTYPSRNLVPVSSLSNHIPSCSTSSPPLSVSHTQQHCDR